MDLHKLIGVDFWFVVRLLFVKLENQTCKICHDVVATILHHGLALTHKFFLVDSQPHDRFKCKQAAVNLVLLTWLLFPLCKKGAGPGIIPQVVAYQVHDSSRFVQLLLVHTVFECF